MTLIKNNFQKKANYIFWQILFIGLFFLVGAFFLIVLIYPKLFLIAKSTLVKLETVCGCVNNFSFTNHPFLFSILILISLTIVVFLLFVFVKTIRFKIATNRFIQLSLKNRKNNISSNLDKTIKALGIEIEIIETKNKSPVVFCFGFFRPKICLSQCLTERLNRSELKAVLLHEYHHAIVYEPIRLFIVKLFEKILFFVPGIEILTRQYIAFCELAADEYATNGFKQKTSLASALSKMIDWEEQLLLRNNLAISFFTSIISERANKLADDAYMPKTKTFPKRYLIGVIIVLAVVLSLGYFLFSSEDVFAIYEDNGCLLTHEEKNTDIFRQCDISLPNSSCVMNYTNTNMLCPPTMNDGVVDN